jgi:DegV family protein with EDD domain
MHIVTDSGTDVMLSAEERAELNIHVVPLVVTLDGVSYREGLDITPIDFYKKLEAGGDLPVTSQPSMGDFAETYRRLAATDPDILSIHISSGLSGTLNSARSAADLVPEANITHIDCKTLSAGAGWQVATAARAIKAGRSVEEAVALTRRIGDATESLYTLRELKYLIHGGRISHMKGLLASLLNIKPIIGVEKEGGTYVQRGQARAFKGALNALVDLIARQHAPGSALRGQVMHSHDPEGATMLRDMIDARFDCEWLPTGELSLVLGAHTGPTMVGACFAPQETFADIL